MKEQTVKTHFKGHLTVFVFIRILLLLKQAKNDKLLLEIKYMKWDNIIKYIRHYNSYLKMGEKILINTFP